MDHGSGVLVVVAVDDVLAGDEVFGNGDAGADRQDEKEEEEQKEHQHRRHGSGRKRSGFAIHDKNGHWAKAQSQK